MNLQEMAAAWLTRRTASEPPLAQQGELNKVLRFMAKWRSNLLANTYARHHGAVVMQGPFAGLRYATPATEGTWIARLLGTYESELHAAIEAFARSDIECVLDVGCAEGFYAVGFARRMPQATVYAYDTSKAARRACAAMAQANGVAERVVLREEFRPEDLMALAGRKCLLFIDAEGAEDELLDLTRGPPLAKTSVIVETHPGARPGVTERLTERFAATHDIVRIDQQGKVARLPDWLRELGHLDQLLAVWEWRSSPTPWLVMRPRSGPPPSRRNVPARRIEAGSADPELDDVP
jgi:hypothetical protein